MWAVEEDARAGVMCRRGGLAESGFAMGWWMHVGDLAARLMHSRRGAPLGVDAGHGVYRTVCV